MASPLAQALSLLVVGGVSGFVLKQQQLHAVASELAAAYPMGARLRFVLLRLIEVGFYFSLDASLVSVVLRVPFFRASARLGETYWILALAYLMGPLARFWLAPALLLVVNVRACLRHGDRGDHGDRGMLRDWLGRRRVTLGCVAAIVAVYAIYFAPLLDPLIAIDQVDRFKAIIPFSLGNTMRATLPAVAGLQEPAWHPQLSLGGGSLRPEIMGHQNYLLSAIFAVLPISSADVIGIFQLEKLAVFLIYCMGGVGYFLFCRHGLRLRHGTALVVGIVAVMSDGILARHFEVDWGYASCAVPLILLAVKRARDANCRWLYALAGGIAGISQSLHFTHPEVILAVMYFVVAWIVWDYALTVPRATTRSDRLRWLAAIPIFCASCVLANYRFIGGMLEFAYDGNQITSERLRDYGAHGPAVVAQQLLGPLGLKGSGPFPEPYVPYFYGVTVGFLVILAVVRLVRRHTSGSVVDTWLSFALVAPILLAIVSLFRSSVVGALYGFGVPGFPFHTGIRILHPVHACVMVLFAFGLEELLAVGDGAAAAAMGRDMVLKALAAFLGLAVLLGLRAPDAAPHHVQVLFAAIAVVVACYVRMPSRVRLGVVGGLVIITVIVATRDFTMVIGVGYHQNVLEKSRVDRKVASNNVPSRLAHPENFSPRVYPLSLGALLQPAREDLADPRTERYVGRLVERFKRDLRRVVAFHRRAGGDGGAAPALKDPTTAEAQGTIAALDRWRADVGARGTTDARALDDLQKLSPVYDRLYNDDRAGGLKEVDRIMASIPVESRYPRIAYSNAFKARAGGDSINDFPTFENSHYYVMGAANLRWPSSLDYFFPDIGKAMLESIYYEANMFPPVSRRYLDLLGFDYLLATDAELPAFNVDTEVIAKTPTGTLLHNKTALPRATLFRRAKVIPPMPYNELNFNSMARVERGRAQLDSIDTKNELLIEAGPSFQFVSDGAALRGQSGESVNIVRIASNLAVFKVHNPGADALLFYSDAHHPDWRAYVDRERREVLRADLAFKAVVVPSGDHLVWMEFVPVRAELVRGLVFLLAACVLMQAARAAEHRRRQATLDEVAS